MNILHDLLQYFKIDDKWDDQNMKIENTRAPTGKGTTEYK